MNLPTFSTLLDLLAFRASASAGAPAFEYAGQACSYSELWEGTNRFAAYLLQLGVEPGERVLLALPNGGEFFPSFYGIQRAGAIAVPLFPGSGGARLDSIARQCGARFLVVPAASSGAASSELETQASSSRLHVITQAESTGVTSLTAFPSVRPDDVAFIQYTSGSTGNPKGVQLTHANLLTNMGQLIAGMKIVESDVFVSWLPVYHDMGLILMTMVPFYLAAKLYILPADLRSVDGWLDALQARRATFTAAPDFAYRLCLRADPEGRHDLSSLRVALNAAEPVRAGTIDSFHRIFRLEPAMIAGYGLAEATVGVATWTPRTTPRVDASGNVSVGRPFPGVEIQILNDGAPAPAGQIGDIAIRSPANTKGYFENPEETARLFWGDGFILSGDLGYLDSEGYLFVVGRKKSIIKVAGETVSPREVEEYVDRVPGVRFSAAVGVDRGRWEGEQLYIFAEVRATDEQDLFDLSLQIRETIDRQLGYRPARVYLLRPRSIPRTHNGKLQYGRLKDTYLDGRLRAEGAILFPDY